MFRINVPVLWKIFFTLSLTTSMLDVGPAKALTSEKDCSRAVSLDLNSTHRGFGNEGEEPALYRVDLPTTGILALDITVTGGNDTLPKIDFHWGSCLGPGGPSPGIAILERSATHLSLASMGTQSLYFRAAPQDPSRALADYKIRSVFLESTMVVEGFSQEEKSGGYEAHYSRIQFYRRAEVEIEEEDIDRLIVSLIKLDDTRSLEKTEEEEADPDPAGQMTTGNGTKIEEEEADPDPAGQTTGIETKTEEEEADPDPAGQTAPCIGTKTEEEEADPDPAGQTAPCIVEPGPVGQAIALPSKSDRLEPGRHYVEYPDLSARSFLIQAHCSLGEVDDYGDSFNCADDLEIGQTTTGTLTNGWGDDEDIFAVPVTELVTLRIEVSGEVEARFELFDPWGQRLDLNDGKADARIIRTLVPGRYFIRVTGSDRAEGAYHLAAEPLYR